MLKVLARLSTALFIGALHCLPAAAEEISVAVASNFARTMEALTRDFQQQTNHTLILAIGSTGKHYAQIKHGAPFDVFFAADEDRPERLEQEDNAITGSRFTYAQGQLVLWSSQQNVESGDGSILYSDNFKHLAIANPKLAPYGRAAKEVLQQRKLWEKLTPQIVRGENINQTLQFVKSGNAQLGFVALSQIISHTTPITTTAASQTNSYWLVPQNLYKPIIQQAILLKDTAASRALVAYIKSDEAREIIRRNGYHTP